MTVRQRVARLRPLAAFGAKQGLPVGLRDWVDDDFKTYGRHLTANYEPGSVCDHVHIIKALHRFRAALSCGGLPRDPWPGVSPNAVANQPIVPALRTPAIPPQTWFSLVRNCWTYIDVFAPDILRADAYWSDLKARPATDMGGEERLRAWLDDPATTVPMRRARPGERSGTVPNFNLLGRIIGVGSTFFQSSQPAGLRRRDAVEALVAAGHTHPGLLPDLTEVTRPDGGRGPWHDSLGPKELWLEEVMLRNACFVFTAALHQ